MAETHHDFDFQSLASYRLQMIESMTDTTSDLMQLTTEQPDSTDPDYLAWVERQIAEGQEQMKDPAQRIPAAKVCQAFSVAP